MKRNKETAGCCLSCLGLQRFPWQPVDIAELLQGSLSENQCTQLYRLKVSASSLNLLLSFFCLSLCWWHCLSSSCCPERGVGASPLLPSCWKPLQHFAHRGAGQGEGWPCSARPYVPISSQIKWAHRIETTGWNWADLRLFSWRSVNISPQDVDLRLCLTSYIPGNVNSCVVYLSGITFPVKTQPRAKRNVTWKCPKQQSWMQLTYGWGGLDDLHSLMDSLLS